MSDPAPHRPEVMFGANVSDELLKAIVRLIFRSSQSAADWCRDNLVEEHRRDNFPIQRRALIESGLYGLRQRFPGTSADPTSNDTDSARHTCIVAGVARITVHKVDGADEMPRHADFRDGYAASNQWSLFEAPPPTPPDAKVYAFVIYATLPGQVFPAFIDVRFPDRTCSRFFGDALRLCDRFPDVVSEFIRPAHVEEEKVPENVPLKPRKDVRKPTEHA